MNVDKTNWLPSKSNFQTNILFDKLSLSIVKNAETKNTIFFPLGFIFSIVGSHFTWIATRQKWIQFRWRNFETMKLLHKERNFVGFCWANERHNGTRLNINWRVQKKKKKKRCHCGWLMLLTNRLFAIKKKK